LPCWRGCDGLDIGSCTCSRHASPWFCWCVISGDKDQNYAEIKTSSKYWEANRLNYKFFDVPGMAHSNADPAQLEAALKWIGL
jgi:hypothetical protein